MVGQPQTAQQAHGQAVALGGSVVLAQQQPDQTGKDGCVQGIDFGDQRLPPQQRSGHPRHAAQHRGQVDAAARFPQVLGRQHCAAHADGCGQRAKKIAAPGNVAGRSQPAEQSQPALQKQNVERVAGGMGEAVRHRRRQQIAPVRAVVGPGQPRRKSGCVEEKGKPCHRQSNDRARFVRVWVFKSTGANQRWAAAQAAYRC